MRSLLFFPAAVVLSLLTMRSFSCANHQQHLQYQAIAETLTLLEQESVEPYSKHAPGRHVCVSHNNITKPVRTRQTYCKPVYKKYFHKCNNNQLCSGIKLSYEMVYRDVLVSENRTQLIHICCPGWTQLNRRNYGCNKPICKVQCQNGGKCIKPETCLCPKGFSGRYCEHDIDECKEEKPCDQICYNTIGSFICHCREDFILLPDNQSCRKEDEDDGIELEVTDLEFHQFDKRLIKLEEMIGEVHTNKITKNDVAHIYESFNNLSKDVSSLQTKLTHVETLKQDVIQLKRQLHQVEKKTSKIDHLMAKYEKLRKCAVLNKICI